MDKILKTLAFQNSVSVSIINVTDLVNKAIKTHNLSRTASAAMGRCFAVASYMCSTLKNKGDKFSITVKGDGTGGNIVIVGNSEFEISGYMDNPTADAPINELGKLDVKKIVGESGRITVLKNLGFEKPFVGTSEIVSGEIAEDFANYFFTSEQQEIGIATGVLMDKNCKCLFAGGVVAVPLPFCDDLILDKLESIMAGFKSISKILLEKGEEGVLKEYFETEEYYSHFPKFKCACSKNYIKSIIVSLGEKECLDIIKNEGKIEVECHFCRKKYTFTKEGVEKLFKR